MILHRVTGLDVIAGLDPAIQGNNLDACGPWMPGSSLPRTPIRGPGMTDQSLVEERAVGARLREAIAWRPLPAADPE